MGVIGFANVNEFHYYDRGLLKAPLRYGSVFGEDGSKLDPSLLVILV